MGSINGLVDITATSISNSGEFYLGNNLATINATDNQLTLVGTSPITIASVALVKTIGIDYDGVTLDLDGSDLAVLKVPNDLTINGTVYNGSVARTITTTDTTYTGTQPISISVANDISLQYDNDTIILDGGDIAVAKVPNDLTFTGYDTGTFDGSSALSINLVDTDTTYTAGNGIQISGSNIIQTKTDNQTIRDSGGGSGNNLEVIKVPNDLTINGTIYNGSVARTITTTDTTYTGGTNINIDGSNNVNLDTTILSQNSIQFNIDGTSTTLAGSNYPQKPTVGTYLNLTSPTNIISPYFLHDVYDPVTTVTQSLTTGFVPIFSSNLYNTFTAQSSNCCIELIVYNFTSSGNRYLYFQLEDGAGAEWSIGTSGGGSGTGTRSTIRTNHAADETDKQVVSQTWLLQGLTIGSSYTVNPAARTNAQYNYLFGGGGYQATILRGYYLPVAGS